MAKTYKYTKSIYIDGKQYKIRADTKSELAVKEYKKRQEVENCEKKITRNTTFNDWTKEWLEAYKKPTVSPDSFASYSSVIKNHILPVLGPLQLKNIKPLHCQKILNNLAGGSKEMIDKASYITSQILEDAVRNGLLIENPAKYLQKPKGTEESRRSITDAERKCVLKVAEYHRAGTWIYLMLYAGLRPGEAAALTWNNVDLKNRVLKVEQNVKRDRSVGSPKTKNGYRKIPISDNLYNRLSNIEHEPFGYVCTNTKGGRLNSTSMQRMWDYFKNEMNIVMGCKVHKGRALPPYWVADDLVPYCFRHTFCTDLQDAGVPINVAKDLMGHSDISITAKIYTHQTDVAFNAAKDAMNAYQNLQNRTPDRTPTLESVVN